MDQTLNVRAKVGLPRIHVMSHSSSDFLTLVFVFFSSALTLSCLTSLLSPPAPLPHQMPEQEAARVSESCLTFTRLSLPLCVPLSAQYPEPRDGGLGKTRGLPEDHSACLCANVWALLPSLALALVLAQHAL